MFRQRAPRVDFIPYVRAFPLLVQNPTLMVAPLLAGVIAIFVGRASGGGAGSGDVLSGLTGGLNGLLVNLIANFAFAVSIVIGDAAWRRGGSVPFDPSWQEARRRGRDILFAAFGYGFVLSIAGLIGGFLSGILGVVGVYAMIALATFAFIYTLPAAAIGGIPGGAALNRSLELAKANPLPTVALALVNAAILFFIEPTLATLVLRSLVEQFGFDGVFIDLARVVIRSIASAYLALVTAKVYADIAFGRRY